MTDSTMLERTATVSAWFTVKFNDDGTTDLYDQAREAAFDWLGVPMAALDDLEIHDIIDTALSPLNTQEKET